VKSGESKFPRFDPDACVDMEMIPAYLLAGSTAQRDFLRNESMTSAVCSRARAHAIFVTDKDAPWYHTARVWWYAPVHAPRLSIAVVVIKSIYAKFNCADPAVRGEIHCA